MIITDPNGYLSYGSKSQFFTILPSVDGGKTYLFNTYRSCREEFSSIFAQNVFLKNYFVGYNQSNGLGGVDYEKAVECWRIIEKRLGLNPCVIHDVEGVEALVVEVDPWWCGNSTKRSFFTLFLRLACVHYKGDFDKAILAYPLAQPIKMAINHFLDGNTTPTFEESELKSSGGSFGVYAKFYGCDQAKLETLLVKLHTPEVKTYAVS